MLRPSCCPEGSRMGVAAAALDLTRGCGSAVLQREGLHQGPRLLGKVDARTTFQMLLYTLATAGHVAQRRKCLHVWGREEEKGALATQADAPEVANVGGELLQERVR